MMQYYLGAYAASPNGFDWTNPALESAYFEKLRANPLISGLEHPIISGLHPFDEQWFLENIAKDWDYSFTCIPAIMGRAARDPVFGLASTDEEGRQRALAYYREVLAALIRLNDHCGCAAVKAVTLYSSPSLATPSDKPEQPATAEHLLGSMEELLSWDWQGARLLIEHCDTVIPGQVPAKGFLSLEDELRVLSVLRGQGHAHCGLLLNWARSVIEGRSKDTILRHLRTARAAGLLDGLIFSGCTDTDCDWPAWSDGHMPPRLKEIPSTEPSLLDHAAIMAARQIVPPDQLQILGIKISVRSATMPADDQSRLDYIIKVLDQSLCLIDNACGDRTAH